MSETINKAMIEELRELMEDDFPLLIETFLTDSDQRLSDLIKAQSVSDATQIRELAHGFKGSASNLGAEALANISYEAESMGRENELDGVEDVIARLSKEYQQVKEYFQSLL